MGHTGEVQKHTTPSPKSGFWNTYQIETNSCHQYFIFLILPSKSLLNVFENWLWFPLCMKLQKKLEINENCCLKWLNSLKIFKILHQDMLLHILGRVFRTPWKKSCQCQDWRNLLLGNPYGQITEFHLLLSPWIVEINTSWWSKISINLLHVLSTFQQKKSEVELLIWMRRMTLSFVPSI